MGVGEGASRAHCYGGIIMKSALRGLAQLVIASAIGAASLAAAHAATKDTERLQQAWRAAISHTPVTGQGCFNASYPLLVWHQVRCATASKSEFSQMQGTGHSGPAGGSDDYAAVTKSLTSTAVGSFPMARHLTSEQGPFGANDYSLQLNSNLIANEPACAGSTTPTFCEGWEQFVFTNGYEHAYIQYWLVFYNGAGGTCPAGWNYKTGDCWKNSRLVAVPQQPITELPNMSISGSAVSRGTDTLVMTTRTKAYSVTGIDNTVSLARNWHKSEFNVFGSGSSEAVFNPGASLAVKVAVTDDRMQKPTCEAGAGTSAETNNLVLGPCKSFMGTGGAPPYIQFIETAPR